jgi:hypothetical protein
MRSPRVIIAATTVATCFLYPAAASAQADRDSGNYLLEPCRAVAEGNLHPDDLFDEGVCAGKLQAFAWDANGLEDQVFRSCRPAAVSIVQLAKVVVAYLDQHPERLHESFNGLALEALAHAWPCPTR